MTVKEAIESGYENFVIGNESEIYDLTNKKHIELMGNNVCYLAKKLFNPKSSNFDMDCFIHKLATEFWLSIQKENNGFNIVGLFGWCKDVITEAVKNDDNIYNFIELIENNIINKSNFYYKLDETVNNDENVKPLSDSELLDLARKLIVLPNFGKDYSDEYEVFERNLFKNNK